MIIDAHAHVFSHLGKATGFDVQSNLMVEQAKSKRFWGRMPTNTLDKKYIPYPGEDVDFRVGKYGRYYWTKHGKECWMQRFPTMMVEIEWPPEHMMAFMDEIGVDKAVLHAGYIEFNYCRKYYAECVKRWPDRFIATVRIDYDIEKNDEYRKIELEKVKSSVLYEGMRGVFQGYPIGQKIDDDRLEPLWSELSSLKIPHIFLTGFQPKQEYLESLDQIETVLKKYPDLIGVIIHLGGNIDLLAILIILILRN